MFSSSYRKVKIDKELFRQLEVAAAKAGYSSTEELIQHVLEREVKGPGNSTDQEEAERQLRGLGYID